MPPFDVIVIGGLNTDFTARGATLPRPGETKDGETFVIGPGGKGANQAVAVARLGGLVALIGAVGDDDRGRELIELARAEGVDVEHVRRVQKAPSGAAVIHVDERAQKQIFAVPGANHHLTVADVRDSLASITDYATADVSVAQDFSPAPAFPPARVVLAQLEVPVECVEAAFRWARENGAKTVLDPAPAIPLPDTLLSIVDVLKPNAGEAGVLTGMRISDRQSARAAARKLLDRGVGAVAIAAGDEGNLLISGEGEHWMPRIKVNAVDATGAGDAFAGTLATFLARGRPLVEAATNANAAAALKTIKLGAQAGLPREEELRAFLERT
jgi:ribokinase